MTEPTGLFTKYIDPNDRSVSSIWVKKLNNRFVVFHVSEDDPLETGAPKWETLNKLDFNVYLSLGYRPTVQTAIFKKLKEAYGAYYGGKKSGKSWSSMGLGKQ